MASADAKVLEPRLPGYCVGLHVLQFNRPVDWHRRVGGEITIEQKTYCKRDFGPSLAQTKLEAFLNTIGYRYTEETHNETYVQFLTAS